MPRREPSPPQPGGGFLLPALRLITVDSVGVGTVPQIPIGVGPLVYAICRKIRRRERGSTTLVGIPRHQRQADRLCAILAVAIDGMRIGPDASGVACRGSEHPPDRAVAYLRIVRRCRSFRWGRQDDLRLDERGIIRAAPLSAKHSDLSQCSRSTARQNASSCHFIRNAFSTSKLSGS
jgi:hypothetical protein